MGARITISEAIHQILNAWSELAGVDIKEQMLRFLGGSGEMSGREITHRNRTGKSPPTEANR